MLGEMLSLGGNLLNNYFAGARQDDAQEFSAQQFATRYQTTVKDMQAAGLNPMLAYGQGGGNAPTSSAASASGGADLGMVHLQSKMTTAQVANIEADTANKDAQKKLLLAQAAQANSSAGQADATVDKLHAEVKKIAEEILNLPVERDRLAKAARLLVQQAQLTSAQSATEGQRWEEVKQKARLLRLEGHITQKDYDAIVNTGSIGRLARELKPVSDIGTDWMDSILPWKSKKPSSSSSSEEVIMRDRKGRISGSRSTNRSSRSD